MEISLGEGARTLSRGLRTSNARTAALGAAILALAFLRSQRERDAELVHVAKLRPGESLRIEVTKPKPASPPRPNAADAARPTPDNE